MTSPSALTRTAVPVILLGAWLASGLATWRSTWRLWQHRRHARRALLELDARCLRDIGLSPQLADYEAGRPFWQPLTNWRT